MFEERIGEDFAIGEAIFGLDDKGDFRVFLIGRIAYLLRYGLEESAAGCIGGVDWI